MADIKGLGVKILGVILPIVSYRNAQFLNNELPGVHVPEEYINRFKRGSILDRNGVVLANSNTDGKKQERVYPFGSLYSQIIGYNSRSYGRSLLEAQYNNDLLNIWEFAQVSPGKIK